MNVLFIGNSHTYLHYMPQMLGELAQAADHHPEIILAWGKVTVRWWTHTLHNIHLNDCILAARCDTLKH